MRIALWVLALSVVGCSGNMNTVDAGRGGGAGGNGGSGGAQGDFNLTTLDPQSSEATYFAVAVDPAIERIGVAYYTPLGTQTMMGHGDYALKYVEWKQGVISPVETIRGAGMGTAGPVQRLVGLTIAFHPVSGEPSVGFLGGGSGFVMGESIFWFQSDAVVATRANGVWTQRTLAQNGNEVACPDMVVSNKGFLVGLWPALTFDLTGTMYFAYRDGHNGQFEMQDWAGSDVEVWQGPVAGPLTSACVQGGGDNKFAWGARIQMVMGASNQPAMVYDRAFSGPDTIGQDVTFQRRNANGTWTAPFIVFPYTNVQTGASLAYDSMEGYGVAAINRPTNQLFYKNSATGAAWSAEDAVFGSGTGGWYPSLAMDPINHEPSIAFYVCSSAANVNEGSCPESEDELRVTQRIGGQWQEKVVDKAGAWSPKLGFFGSGRRVVVYRDPRSGVLKLAVEK